MGDPVTYPCCSHCAAPCPRRGHIKPCRVCDLPAKPDRFTVTRPPEPHQ